jgi:hypothetical protein
MEEEKSRTVRVLECPLLETKGCHYPDLRRTMAFAQLGERKSGVQWLLAAGRVETFAGGGRVAVRPLLLGAFSPVAGLLESEWA